MAFCRIAAHDDLIGSALEKNSSMSKYLSLTIVLCVCGCSEPSSPQVTTSETVSTTEAEFAAMFAEAAAMEERLADRANEAAAAGVEPCIGFGEGFGSWRALQNQDPRDCEAMLAAFTKSDWHTVDWHTVHYSATALERQPQKAMPLLVKLLERDERIELTGTYDLIYPGAHAFYGHGFWVDYDLDWLSVRTGWLIEKTAFQDFGFSEDEIRAVKVLPEGVVEPSEMTVRESTRTTKHWAPIRKELRAKAIAQALTWWHSRDPKWTRLTALQNALNSQKSSRVVRALSWIRYETSPIDGFTRESYIRDIYPIVRRLAESEDETISRNAQQLVDDFKNDKWSWLEMKVRERIRWAAGVRPDYYRFLQP